MFDSKYNRQESEDKGVYLVCVENLFLYTLTSGVEGLFDSSQQLVQQVEL